MHLCFFICAKISENSNCMPSKGWKANNINYCRKIVCKDSMCVWVDPTDGLLC